MTTHVTQLISGEGEYIGECGERLREWGFDKVGTEYRVVSILGCQSSGKSTLLNLVFGTSFRVMDDTQGRTQTTRGIWLGHCDGEGRAPLLVLDVEGTDGRERGEDEKTFERQTSLLSLALAQTLVVNMWTTDVGRHEAANYGLLKTVFEQNLRLFQHDRRAQKTTVLFLFRDYSGKIPLEKLTSQMQADLTGTIWGSLAMPNGLENAEMGDFFDLRFLGMPNFEFQHDQFAATAADLRVRFTDPTRDDYLFAGEAGEGVPADGWATYVEGIWQTILLNKDLDLPSQRESLATKRCDEVARECADAFAAAAAPLADRLRARGAPAVDNFAAVLRESFERAMADFDAQTSRYMPRVVRGKRSDLVHALHSEAYTLFRQQVAKIKAAVLAQFDKDAEAATAGDPGAFGDLSARLSAEATRMFDAAVDEARLEGAAWPTDDAREELEAAVADRLRQLKRAQLEQLRKDLRKAVAKSVLLPARVALERGEADAWQVIRAAHTAALAEAQTQLRTRLVAFGAEDEEIAEQCAALEDDMRADVVDMARRVASSVQGMMKSRFDVVFFTQDDGKPRYWGPDVEVDPIFDRARASGAALLDLLALVRLDAALDPRSPLADDWYPDDVDPDLVLIDRDAARQIRSKFDEDVRAAHSMALAEQQRIASPQSMSILTILLMCVLGWNEFIMVLQNPFLLVVTIIIAAAIFALHKAGLLTPATQAVTSLLGNILSQQSKQKKD